LASDDFGFAVVVDVAGLAVVGAGLKVPPEAAGFTNWWLPAGTPLPETQIN
jgi:hypothetical protein